MVACTYLDNALSFASVANLYWFGFWLMQSSQRETGAVLSAPQLGTSKSQAVGCRCSSRIKLDYDKGYQVVTVLADSAAQHTGLILPNSVVQSPMHMDGM
jgi:hypothetical protein